MSKYIVLGILLFWQGFAENMTGPDNLYQVGIAPYDLDFDIDIDLHDVALWQNEISVTCE